MEGWTRRGGRMAAVLLLVLALMLLYAVARADTAQAEPRIKVGCRIYDTNRVDPIAYSAHLHHHFGNTSTTNKSTGRSLLASKETFCNMPWFTTAGWFPVERHEPVSRVAVYYRAPGDQAAVRPIPKGLQLLATEQQYNCNEGAFQDSPPYRCKANFNTRLIFPDCWNKRSLEETSMVYGNGRGECPSSHPYRIPRINYLIQHDNDDGRVPNPLMVSAGVDAWARWNHMHGDYFTANRSVFNDKLLDLCLRKQPDRATPATTSDRCGKGVNE